MAITHLIFAYTALVFLVPNVCHSYNRKVQNMPNSYYYNPPPNTYYNNPPPNTYYNNPPPNTNYNNNSQSDWKSTIATFYGDKDGPGSVGGACGYEAAVQSPPYNSRIVAVEPSLFQDGFGCGLCYEIKCIEYPSCSDAPVKVVATDLCPGGACTTNHLFDLSGAAVEDLAKTGEEDQLRTVGNIEVLYKQVTCDFQVDVTFRVDPGSGANYFAMAVEFENKGEILKVSVKDAGMSDWLGMTRSWGSVFMTVFDHAFAAPLSFQVSDAKQTIEAMNVIPENYEKDKAYVSTVNFNS